MGDRAFRIILLVGTAISAAVPAGVFLSMPEHVRLDAVKLSWPLQTSPLHSRTQIAGLDNPSHVANDEELAHPNGDDRTWALIRKRYLGAKTTSEKKAALNALRVFEDEQFLAFVDGVKAINNKLQAKADDLKRQADELLVQAHEDEANHLKALTEQMNRQLEAIQSSNDYRMKLMSLVFLAISTLVASINAAVGLQGWRMTRERHPLELKKLKDAIAQPSIPATSIISETLQE